VGIWGLRILGFGEDGAPDGRGLSKSQVGKGGHLENGESQQRDCGRDERKRRKHSQSEPTPHSMYQEGGEQRGDGAGSNARGEGMRTAVAPGTLIKSIARLISVYQRGAQRLSRCRGPPPPGRTRPCQRQRGDGHRHGGGGVLSGAMDTNASVGYLTGGRTDDKRDGRENGFEERRGTGLHINWQTS